MNPLFVESGLSTARVPCKKMYIHKSLLNLKTLIKIMNDSFGQYRYAPMKVSCEGPQYTCRWTITYKKQCLHKANPTGSFTTRIGPSKVTCKNVEST